MVGFTSDGVAAMIGKKWSCRKLKIKVKETLRLIFGPYIVLFIKKHFEPKVYNWTMLWKQ